jgi:hypothetical protein
MRRALLGATGLAALWAGCQGALFHIRVADEASTTVDAATPLEVLIDDLGFGEFDDMDITAAEELQNQGVAPGDISSVEFTEFTLEAPGADLSFLRSMELWVEAPGLDPVLVAHQDIFPIGVELVEMTLEDVDLADHVVSESMTIRTEVTGERPDVETEVIAAYALRIGVTRQGCAAATRRD